MKYILVFIGLSLLFSFVSAQEQTQGSSTIDNPNNQTVLENEDSEKSEKSDKQATAEQEASSVEASLPAESDFDVFRPSEDISEDLAVPFPVDI